MPFKPGQSGNPGGKPKGAKRDTYALSLRRLMDRAISSHEASVEDALVAAVTHPKQVLSGLELWGRARREIGPNTAEDATGRVLNVAIVLGEQAGPGDAALPAGRLSLHLNGGHGASE